MAGQGVIRIDGLRELQAALRAMDGESQKQLRVALNEAAELIVAGARRKMPSESGKAKQSLKAASGQREAQVSLGGRRAPYAPWLDFGGRVGPRRSVIRPYKKQGRYVYKTLADEHADITELLVEAIDRVARDAGLEVT